MFAAHFLTLTLIILDHLPACSIGYIWVLEQVTVVAYSIYNCLQHGTASLYFVDSFLLTSSCWDFLATFHHWEVLWCGRFYQDVQQNTRDHTWQQKQLETHSFFCPGCCGQVAPSVSQGRKRGSCNFDAECRIGGMPDIFDFFRGACKFVWKVGCQLECQGWSWQVLCKFCVEVGCQIKCQGSSWQVRCIFRKNQHLEVEILINCGVSKCLLHFFENCF